MPPSHTRAHTHTHVQEIELGDYVIPPGWNVGVSIYAIHMSEALWERPADFWPERCDAT
jgi:cytochrome P450